MVCKLLIKSHVEIKAGLPTMLLVKLKLGKRLNLVL